MPVHQYGVGLHNVGSYQVSGMPFASGSISATASYQMVTFPYVTSWVQIINHDSAELTVAFSQDQIQNSSSVVGANHFKVHGAHNVNHAGGYLPKLDMKVTRLYFTGSDNFDVVAGLTNISTGLIPDNWSGSTGVG